VPGDPRAGRSEKEKAAENKNKRRFFRAVLTNAGPRAFDDDNNSSDGNNVRAHYYYNTTNTDQTRSITGGGRRPETKIIDAISSK